LATSQRARADADDATRDKLNRAVVHRKSRFHECSTSYWCEKAWPPCMCWCPRD